LIALKLSEALIPFDPIRQRYGVLTETGKKSVYDAIKLEKAPLATNLNKE